MSELNEIERGQLCQSTIESLYEATGGLKQFPGLLRKIITHKAWERRVSKGKVIELASLRELITERPVRGWGEDVDKVRAVIRDDAEALRMFNEAMKLKPGTRTDLATNSSEDAEHTRNTVHGTTRAYSIERVQRECEPEVVAKVMSGEMSPNASNEKAPARMQRLVLWFDVFRRTN